MNLSTQDMSLNSKHSYLVVNPLIGGTVQYQRAFVLAYGTSTVHYVIKPIRVMEVIRDRHPIRCIYAKEQVSITLSKAGKKL